MTVQIKHRTRVTALHWDDGTVSDLRVTATHDVVDAVGARAQVFLGRCDSCGREIVRGAGRWWEPVEALQRDAA